MRNSIQDFSLANPIYAGATVNFYTVSGGVKTATLATLYAALTGSTTLANPQSLDSDGKFQQPVYIDAPVISTVSGLTIADHDTGIIQSVLSAASVNDVYGAFASTVAGEGSALIGFLQAGTGAVATTAQAKMREAFSVKDFGAVGDGVADDGAEIQACFTAAVAAGKAVAFPSGTYLSGAKISTSGASVAVQGDGVSVTKVIFTATTGGFEFALDAQGAGVPPDQLYFDGLTIESRAAVSTPALSATWATYQSNAQGQAWISNVNVVRKADGTGSFTDGIKLNKCFVGFISRVVLVGDDARVSARGISLVDCVGIRITDFDINRYAMGVSITKVSATQTEGIFLTNGFIYDINKGVFVDTAIHINISGTHVNVNGASAEYSVRFVSVAQSVISDGCLIYCGGEVGDAANQDGIQLDTCNSVNIGGSTVVGITKVNTRYGVVLTDCDYNTVTTNNVSNLTIGIFVSSSASDNNMLLGNGFYGCTTNITDSGTLTYRGGNVDLDSGEALDSVRWGAAHGSFGVGELSTDANWGGYIRGRSGSVGDLGLADSNNVVCGVVKAGSFRVKPYAKASLPSVTGAGGGLIAVTDEAGGYTLAFCDGTNWRRVSDLAIVS